MTVIHYGNVAIITNSVDMGWNYGGNWYGVYINEHHRHIYIIMKEMTFFHDYGEVLQPLDDGTIYWCLVWASLGFDNPFIFST